MRITTVFDLQVSMLLKKEIKNKKSISKLFSRHFRSEYDVLRPLYIDDRVRMLHAFIRLKLTPGDLVVIGLRALQTDQ